MNFAVDLFTILRAAGGAIFVPLWTVFWSVVVVLLGSLGLRTATTVVMWFWSRGILFYFGIRLVSDGFERLDVPGGGIVAFNHQSNFDIPAVTGLTFKPIRFGAKIELFSIPFFGQALAAAGVLPISRDNRSKVIQIYKNAAVRFKTGALFALAPEGTRQKEPIIGPFKKGPFIFAASSGVPVFPLVIEGADRVQKKGSWVVNRGKLSRTIRVSVQEPLWASQKPNEIGEDLPSDVVQDLLDRTRSVILKRYAELQVENRD